MSLSHLVFSPWKLVCRIVLLLSVTSNLLNLLSELYFISLSHNYAIFTVTLPRLKIHLNLWLLDLRMSTYPSKVDRISNS